MNIELFQKREEPQRVEKLPEGQTVFEMNHIVQIVDDQYEHNGKTIKQTIWSFADGKEYSVPIHLNNRIVDMVEEYGQQLESIRIERKGADIKTKYDLFPKLKKD